MSAIDPYKLKISRLRILVAVAEYKNFSEAALYLEISQSAVSHAIASLENDLGVILFNRGRNGAELTTVGEQLIAPAKQVLNLLQNIVNEANKSKGLEGGTVRLVAFRSAAAHILPAIIARFCRRFPLIKVNVTDVDENFEIENILRSNQADIGLVDTPCSPEFETWKMYREEYVILLHRSFNIDRTTLTWEQLASYPLIISAKHSCSHKIRECLKRSPKAVNIAYQMHEDSSIVGMAVEKLGAAIMPLLAAEPIPEQLKVYHFPVPLNRTIQAATLKDALHTPAVFAFLDVLKNSSAVV